jgi:hypothetical protein
MQAVYRPVGRGRVSFAWNAVFSEGGTMAIPLRRSDADVQAYLERADRERARRLEAFAIEALELGVAFDETREGETDADEPVGEPST